MHRLARLFASITYLVGLVTVSAQVSVSPLYARIEFSETGQAQATFTVTNASTEAVRFRATFSPFRFGKEGLELTESSDEIGGDLSPYLRAAPLEFEVPALDEQTVRVVALVPPSAIETELRAALVIEPLVDTSTLPENETTGGGATGRVLFTYSFIAQLYASRSGLQAALSIEEPLYDPSGELRIVFANNGSVSGISSTTWQLKKGEEVIRTSEKPARYIVLPEDIRNGVIAENLELEPGEYTLTGTFGVEDGGEPPVVLNPQPFTKTFVVE